MFSTKKVLLILTVIALLVTFVSPSGQTAGPRTITFWHIWDGTRVKLIEEQIADFEAIYPDIKVKHTLIAANAMTEKYLTAIAGGAPPDVIMLRAGDMPSFAVRKALVPLDKYIKKDAVKTEEVFFGGELSPHKYKGTTYSLPVVTGGGNFLLFWNKAVFREAGLNPEQPPKTWAELTEMAKKLTVFEGKKLKRLAFNPLAGGSVPERATPFQLWSATNNTSYLSGDGKKVLFNSKEGLRTFEFLQDYINNVCGGYDNISAIAGPDRNTNRLAFYNGQSAMINEGSYFFFMAKKEAPNLDFGAAELPYNSANPKAASKTPTEGGWGYAIPSNSKNIEAAWKWIKYTTAMEGNRKFCLAQQRPSPVKQYSTDPVMSQGNDYWPVVLSSLDHGVAIPPSPVRAKLKDTILQMEEKVWFNKMTPKDALKWGAEEGQKVLDEWYNTH